jgi:3D (Asp-Asp-Asp) domain-containing protein
MKAKFAIVKRMLAAFAVVMLYAAVPIILICSAPGFSQVEAVYAESLPRIEETLNTDGVSRAEIISLHKSPKTNEPDFVTPVGTDRLSNSDHGTETEAEVESEETVAAPVDKEPEPATVWETQESAIVPDDSAILEPESVSEVPNGTWVIRGCTLTAYCSCPMCCDNFTTYTGTTVTEGRTVAVDPRVIPLGSIVTVAGHDYIAEDAGVIGNWVDIYFDTHDECVQFGLQYGDVYITTP